MVRKRFPENCRSFLFYGPPGTGKTMVVRACVTETNSVLFDMSPSNIEGLYQAKKEEERLVASVMVAAKEYQPSIIYIDEVEKVVPAKKKGKKGKKGSKKKLDPSDPKRIKKPLGKWRTKFIDDKTRITIIGCTSEPEEGSKKEFKKFFDRQIYFPFPDYTTRRMMWRHFMQSKGAIIKSEFPLSTLAHISHGYSAGSIKKTCNVVLTKYRIESQEKRPLTLPEFIGPLSICQNTMDEQYEEFLVSPSILQSLTYSNFDFRNSPTSSQAIRREGMKQRPEFLARMEEQQRKRRKARNEQIQFLNVSYNCLFAFLLG